MSNQIPDPESLILAMAKNLAPAVSLDPIMIGIHTGGVWVAERLYTELNLSSSLGSINIRSEEHTSELQSRTNLVCRLLLEKKKIK